MPEAHLPGHLAGTAFINMLPVAVLSCVLVLIAVEALVTVASRPVGVTHIWALHGLWLVAGATGVGYAAHVKHSLQLALELLVRERAAHSHLHQPSWRKRFAKHVCPLYSANLSPPFLGKV